MKNEEYPRYLNMMNQWLILKQEKKSVETYLCRQGYRKIAIYGMGIYGRHLARDLAGGDITVSYGIDRKIMTPYNDITIFQPDGELPEIDIIINSVICCQNEVEQTLRKVTSAPMIGLDELIHESYFT